MLCYVIHYFIRYFARKLRLLLSCNLYTELGRPMKHSCLGRRHVAYFIVMAAGRVLVIGTRTWSSCVMLIM